MKCQQQTEIILMCLCAFLLFSQEDYLLKLHVIKYVKVAKYRVNCKMLKNAHIQSLLKI